jgi:hypothetical protein
MSKLVITSSANENFATALGISHARQGEIFDVLQEADSLPWEIKPKSLSDMAAYLSEKMDLTPNEILFIGYKLSQVALMRMESSQAPTEEELMEMLLASGTVALAEA